MKIFFETAIRETMKNRIMMLKLKFFGFHEAMANKSTAGKILFSFIKSKIN